MVIGCTANNLRYAATLIATIVEKLQRLVKLVDDASVNGLTF